jgi:RHS repeat-associated protein
MIRAARTYPSPCPSPPPAGKGEGVASVNGNITELERYAGVDKIDDLEYYYDHSDHTAKLDLSSNRLYLVDEQSTHPGGNDLKSGTKTAAGFDRNDDATWNYHYDPIGNLIKDVNDSIDLITWTVTGKVSEVIFASSKDDLSFRYDPMGNRIAKVQKPKNWTDEAEWTITWYARDAQGNVLAVYNKPQDSLNFRATEFNIYGSSRIGMVTQPEALSETPTVPMAHSLTLGLKVYEFSNHLGNVLTTFSDRKLATETTPGYVAYYTAEILSSTDYYPFGFQMPGRVYEGDYRYGFNGKEQDPETYGKGNIYDYGFRIYNPRIGRFLTIDPFLKTFPFYTPYQFSANMPIAAVDLDGLEAVIKINSPWYFNEIQKAINDGDVQRAIYLASKSVGDPAKNDYAKKLYGSDYAGTFNYSEQNPEGLTVYNSNGDMLFNLKQMAPESQKQGKVAEESKGFWANLWDGIKRVIGIADDALSGSGDKVAHKGGGIMFTSSSGQGQETRVALYGSKVDGPINIDDLLGVIGATKASSGGPPKNALEGFARMVDSYQIGQDIREQGEKLGGNRSSETFICPTCDKPFHAKDTTKHNEDLKRKSGPFTPAKKQDQR